MAKIGLQNIKWTPITTTREISVTCESDKIYNFLFDRERPKKKLPERYIINKGATILFWDKNENEKTIVKKSKDDKFDKRLGFLTAYFQYHSGLSKTKANKYLDELEVED